MYVKYIKRIIDFMLSLIAIICLSPLLALLIVIVYFNLGSPVIFTQMRVGMNEKQFKIYKFRSMTDKRDEKGNLLPDTSRLTKFGSILRSLSLDELPQLWNVLKGDLAIVGSRPLLPEYHDFYKEEERGRFNIRAGLVQPEVMYGITTPTWDEQFKYEVEYAQNVNFITDVKIIFCTFKILLKRSKSNYGSSIRVPLNVERQSACIAEEEIKL